MNRSDVSRAYWLGIQPNFSNVSSTRLNELSRDERDGSNSNDGRVRINCVHGDRIMAGTQLVRYLDSRKVKWPIRSEVRQHRCQAPISLRFEGTSLDLSTFLCSCS